MIKTAINYPITDLTSQQASGICYLINQLRWEINDQLQICKWSCLGEFRSVESQQRSYNPNTTERYNEKHSDGLIGAAKRCLINKKHTQGFKRWCRSQNVVRFSLVQHGKVFNTETELILQRWRKKVPNQQRPPSIDLQHFNVTESLWPPHSWREPAAAAAWAEDSVFVSCA